MKPTVLKFGLISGTLAILFMLSTLPFIGSVDYRKADLLGYTSMVASALVVFFGIRSFRERHAGGRLGFGRGLAVGLSITLVSCACQVVAFELVYFRFVPDFGDKFAACMVDRARASGATPSRLDEVQQQAQTLKGFYDQPFSNAALTFATSFPIGLVAAAISAAILRRR